MLSKEKMFKITSVIMESGCTKYFLYRNEGWLHFICCGSRYMRVGKYDTLHGAVQQLNTLYMLEANSCIKSREKHIWPN